MKLNGSVYYNEMFSWEEPNCKYPCKNAVSYAIEKINRERKQEFNLEITSKKVVSMLVRMLVSNGFEPLFLTRDYISIIHFGKLETEEDRREFAVEIFLNLPKIHRRVLIVFLTFLQSLVQRRKSAVDVADRLSTIFAPYLVRPYNGVDKSDSSQSKPFVTYCINNIVDLSNACAGLD